MLFVLRSGSALEAVGSPNKHKHFESMMKPTNMVLFGMRIQSETPTVWRRTRLLNFLPIANHLQAGTGTPCLAVSGCQPVHMYVHTEYFMGRYQRLPPPWLPDLAFWLFQVVGCFAGLWLAGSQNRPKPGSGGPPNSRQGLAASCSALKHTCTGGTPPASMSEPKGFL